MSGTGWLLLALGVLLVLHGTRRAKPAADEAAAAAPTSAASNPLL